MDSGAWQATLHGVARLMDTVRVGEGGMDAKFADSKFHVGSLKPGNQRSEVVEVSKPVKVGKEFSLVCRLLIRLLVPILSQDTTDLRGQLYFLPKSQYKFN